MYVHVDLYVYICKYAYICIYACIYTYVCMCLCGHVHAYVHIADICIYACTRTYVYVSMHVCVPVCLDVFLYSALTCARFWFEWTQRSSRSSQRSTTAKRGCPRWP